MVKRPGSEIRSNSISQILAGWQPARVLLTANRLGLFNAINDGAISAEDVASRCGTHLRTTQMLLNACVTLGLMEKDGSLYRNSPEAREMLVRGKPGYTGDSIDRQDYLWRLWSRLNDAVRNNKSALQLDNEVEDLQVHRDFMLTMHDRALRWAPVIVEALDLSGRQQLFDAGGGPGTFSIFMVKRYPGLRAIVFDLPEILDITRNFITKYSVADRVTTRAGDFFKDGFGKGNDVVLFSTILRNWGEEHNRILLRKAYDSLIPGGLLVVHEGLIDEDGLAPKGAVLFSLNLLVTSGEGHSYSASEIKSLMREAGFADFKTIPLPESLGTTLLTAVKP